MGRVQGRGPKTGRRKGKAGLLGPAFMKDWMAGLSYWAAGSGALGVENEVVERLVGPLAALALQGRRIVEAPMRGQGAADHPVEVRADLVRAALLEGVAGGALLGRSLALGRIGLGEENRERLGRGCRSGAGGCAFFGGREVIAGNGRLLRREQAAGDDVDADHEKKRAEHGARDLIGLDIHGLGSPRHRKSAKSPQRDQLADGAPATWRCLAVEMGF